jgi:hypothetical protein
MTGLIPAVVAALTPICVEKFLQNSDAKANLAVLQKTSTNWEQGDYLEKGGWATPPGATSPDYKLARAGLCHELPERKARVVIADTFCESLTLLSSTRATWLLSRKRC